MPDTTAARERIHHKPANKTTAGNASGWFKQRLFRVDASDQLPLTLKHERIYILPTARGLAFIAVALVMILASMNYGLNLGYALSFILVGLFASCLLSTFLNLSRLTIHSISGDDTFAGKPIEYNVILQEEKGKTRYSITLQAAQATATIDAIAHTNSTAVLRQSESERGEHHLGRITISSDFPLGLWRGWGYLHAPARTYVYPKPETPTQPYPSAGQQHSDARMPVPDEREFDQLKQYQTTDAPASVAWKTVASGRGWFTKEFTSAQASRELELTWDATNGLSDTEQRLSRLCAWIVSADASAVPYSLELPAARTNSARGPEHKRHCLRQLSGFRPPPL